MRFIVDFARDHGFPPTVREIGSAFGGIKSSTVAYYIKVLVKKGKLERGSSRARDLRLASPASTYGISGTGTRGCPILGRFPAGRPNLVQEEIEDTLWLDERIARSKDTYIVRVKGNSMTGRGILDGDLAVVRPQKNADTGEIVVAVTPEGEGTIKTLRRKGDNFYLEAANPNYPNVYQPFEIVGKVISIIRQL